jgi:hypothetical protein
MHNNDGCIFNIPASDKYGNPNRIDAQIHYDIAYAKVFPNASNTINDKFYHRDLSQNTWTCYPAGNTVSDYNLCPSVNVDYGVINHHV